MIHRTLYKRDRAGNIRGWAVEIEGNRYRYHTGVVGGATTISGWTTAFARSQPTPEAQAQFEVEATYRHQLERDYFETVDEVDTPRIFEPMLASKYKRFRPGFAQPKLDGMRSIAKASGLFSRQGKPILSAPHVIKALEPFFDRHPDAILDGELYNHDYKDQFEALMSLARKGYPGEGHEALQYHVYDYPSAPGGFRQRWAQLTADNPFDEVVHKVETAEVLTFDQYEDLDAAWLDDKYEGSMWRDADGEYVIGGRPSYLQKRVTMISDEYEFLRLEEGNGNWAGIPKSVVCRLPGAEGREFSAGIEGDKAFCVSLRDRHIVQVTIVSKGLTKNGVPRCGIAKDWHGAGGRQD